MASREDNPMWLEAEIIINTLFHDDTNSVWQKLSQQKIIAAASGATTMDFDVEQCCEIRDRLKEGFSHIFKHSHVDTFWEGLVFKLKKATSINPAVSRKRKNEAHLVTSLIYPTLKKVVDSISIIPEKHVRPTDVEQHQVPITSHLVIQDEIKTGNTSVVDASIQINDGKKCRVLIPVEAKVEIEQNHLYQIAAYVTKVSTAPQLEKKVVIGIIIDKENFHLVFSPYFYHYKSEASATPVPIPIPIVYISPPITWRNSSPQSLFSIIPAALLVIACTCYFQRDRIEYVEKIDSQVLGTARKLLESRHKIEPFCDDVLSAIHDLLQISKKQQEDITDLKNEIDDLKKKLHLDLKQNDIATLTDSESNSASIGDSTTA